MLPKGRVWKYLFQNLREMVQAKPPGVSNADLEPERIKKKRINKARSL